LHSEQFTVQRKAESIGFVSARVKVREHSRLKAEVAYDIAAKEYTVRRDISGADARRALEALQD
jgi:hypothetical protein